VLHDAPLECGYRKPKERRTIDLGSASELVSGVCNFEDPF
jgi:hypothetical protein